MRTRPKKHFTPANNWVNDPNGLIFYGGFYHLYFQHNPVENKWGHMSWGHARSKDLINWEELPIAISEQPDHMIFSGSAISDEANNRIAAFYTAHKEGHQSQWVCFSHDNGNSFSEHQKVLDLNLEDFRDPKVFKYQDRWIMVTVKATQHLVAFFESRDLINWKALSDYQIPDVNELYECPDLFELNGIWVLFLSTNPGGPAGGSGMYYVIGNFDGKIFTETSIVKPLDYGPDYYAAVTFNDAPCRTSIAWMNNWQYANQLKRETWNGSMTVARKLEFVNSDLKQSFICETENFLITENDFAFKYQNGELKFKNSAGKLIIDRSELWSSAINQFEVPTSAPYDIQAVFDAESIELSINGLMVTAQIEVGAETPILSVGSV
ncbi:MAG: hypothetical protein RL193_928 [Actinomycetota bacterium]|jgi:levanase/fructan beta-fructosidase